MDYRADIKTICPTPDTVPTYEQVRNSSRYEKWYIYNYAEDPAKQLIQSFIDRNKIVEAIILDTIAFNDSQKLVKTTNTYFDSATGKNKKFVSYVEKLWPYKVVKNLNSLTDDYKKYFNLTYSINPEKFTAAFNSIKKANNTKLYKFLDATLEDARKNCVA